MEPTISNHNFFVSYHVYVRTMVSLRLTLRYKIRGLRSVLMVMVSINRNKDNGRNQITDCLQLFKKEPNDPFPVRTNHDRM